MGFFYSHSLSYSKSYSLLLISCYKMLAIKQSKWFVIVAEHERTFFRAISISTEIDSRLDYSLEKQEALDFTKELDHGY